MRTAERQNSFNIIGGTYQNENGNISIHLIRSADDVRNPTMETIPPTKMRYPKINREIGKSIESIRKEKRKGQEYMANRAGIGINTYRKMERGEFDIAVGDVIKVAKAMGVTTSRIIDEKK